MGEFPSLPCLTLGNHAHVHCPQFAADSRAATSRQATLTETSPANRRPCMQHPLAGKATAGKTHSASPAGDNLLWKRPQNQLPPLCAQRHRAQPLRPRRRNRRGSSRLQRDVGRLIASGHFIGAPEEGRNGKVRTSCASMDYTTVQQK